MYEKRVKQNRVCGGARGKLINSFARRDCFIRNTLKEQNLIHISVGPRRYIIVGYTVVGERGVVRHRMHLRSNIIPVRKTQVKPYKNTINGNIYV